MERAEKIVSDAGKQSPLEWELFILFEGQISPLMHGVGLRFY